LRTLDTAQAPFRGDKGGERSCSRGAAQSPDIQVNKSLPGWAAP